MPAAKVQNAAPRTVPQESEFFYIFWLTAFLILASIVLGVLKADPQTLAFTSHLGTLGFGYIAGGYKAKVTRIR